MAASSMESQHMADASPLPWWRQRMVGLDLETTSPEPTTARIVQAALVLVGGDDETVKHSWLVDPGVEIPAEATTIHGITNELARAGGKHPIDVLPDLARGLSQAKDAGLPLVVMNAPYDLTVIAAELRRYGLDPLAFGHVIDPKVLDKAADRFNVGRDGKPFHRRGSRKLDALCKFWGAKLDQAHDACFDAIAAARVAYQIGRKVPAIGNCELSKLMEWQRACYEHQARGLEEHWVKKGDARRVDSFEWPVRTLPPPTERLVP